MFKLRSRGRAIDPAALLLPASRPPRQTPSGAAGRGAVAGLTATLLLSVLARVMPGMSNQPDGGRQPQEGRPPSPNPDDPEAVQTWQDQARSPAAFQSPDEQDGESAGGSPGITPTGALVQPTAPGPEGLAEQFAFKVAAGLFDRDLAAAARPAGLAVHFVYGSAWGVL